jgi:hypothetical protein
MAYLSGFLELMSRIERPTSSLPRKNKRSYHIQIGFSAHADEFRIYAGLSAFLIWNFAALLGIENFQSEGQSRVNVSFTNLLPLVQTSVTIPGYTINMIFFISSSS